MGGRSMFGVFEVGSYVSVILKFLYFILCNCILVYKILMIIDGLCFDM